MPSVPKVPGVPPLTSYLDATVTLLVADAVSLLFPRQSPWGVYRDGAPAFDYDSFNGFSRRKESAIADYQVEPAGAGQATGFMSYDKVERPATIRVRLISRGSEQARAALIQQVEAAEASLDLFDIVTPERFYLGYNIGNTSIERTAQDGVGVAKIDIMFQQVRTSEASAFSNTQQPGSAGQQGGGNVQPTSAPAGAAAGAAAFPLGSVL